MLGAGALHFVTPAFFDAAVPRAFPPSWRRPITHASGVVELLCGAMLLHPRTRAAGARLTELTLIGVLPANVDTVLAGGLSTAPGWLGTRQAAIARLPLQIPPILAARSIRRDAGPAS